MENQIYLLTNSTNNIFIFNDTEALKNNLAEYHKDNVERIEQAYKHRPEVAKRTMESFFSNVRVVMVDKEVLFNSGFLVSDIARYSCKQKQWNPVTGEYYTDYLEKTVSSWNFTSTKAYEKAKEECKKFNETIRINSRDITDEFIEKVEEVVVGKAIKAKVTKKSLKSFGKEVKVVDKRFQDTEELEKLRNSLERVTVNVPGWGTITMSPDSLGEFEVKPITLKTTIYKLI